MNKRPGHVVVTTEVAFCSFCGRPRTLRNEQHQLGTLVRTIVTCETCHRTLSSSVGVASAEPIAEELPAMESQAQRETAASPPKAQQATPAAKPAAKPAAPRKAAAAGAKVTAAKSRTQKKTR